MQVAPFDDIVKDIRVTADMTMQDYAKKVYNTIVSSLYVDLQDNRWNPLPGEWAILSDGEVIEIESDPDRQMFGMERSTRTAAVYAASKMREHNRLLAYAAEYCPNHEFEKGNDDANHHVFRVGNSWSSSVERVYTPGIVYMPKDVAFLLAAKLNSGVVVL